VAVCLAAFGGSVACKYVQSTSSTTPAPLPPPLPGQTQEVFTTARPTLAAAVNDFFGRRPIGEQPIEFPHNTHIGKGISCDTCHDGVMTGPVAGLPSVKACMICHEVIATDRPLIQQITALRDKGLDLNWSRVYGYVPEAAVKFNHAPHIRAKVECATCHGNIAEQTIAQRNVDLNMGFCVNCHRENKAPDDCLTCHF
jgi:hypothetical protein